MTPRELTLHKGQAVPWPHAPMHVAQVDELRRRTVRLFYPTLSGGTRRPIVKPAAIAAAIDRPPRAPSLLLVIDNPFGRARLRPCQRTYQITAAREGAQKGNP